MAKPEIAKVLVLSTAHLPETVDKALTANVEAYPEISCDRITWGYLVWVRESGYAAGEPWDTLFAYANNLHCQWIKFDCDGPVMPDLPSWDW